MKRIVIGYTHDELFYLSLIIQDSLLEIKTTSGVDRIKVMTLCILVNLYKRLSPSIFNSSKNRKISFNLWEAQALVIAYEKGWIKAKETDEFAKNTLRKTYNYLHQKTA